MDGAENKQTNKNSHKSIPGYSTCDDVCAAVVREQLRVRRGPESTLKWE